MPIATLNGIRLNYDVTGEGPLVLLIMGTGSPGRVWRTYQVPALVKAGFRVATVDNRGIAPSDECGRLLFSRRTVVPLKRPDRGVVRGQGLFPVPFSHLSGIPPAVTFSLRWRGSDSVMRRRHCFGPARGSGVSWSEIGIVPCVGIQTAQ